MIRVRINAELLIDHAWGWEPVTIAEIKAYKPENNSMSSGQVLQEPYDFKKARLVAMEMADMLSLDLVEKKLETDQIVVAVGYDIENLSDPERRQAYTGEVVVNYYGKPVPKDAHGSVNLGCFTSSTEKIVDAVRSLFDRIVDPALLVRRLTIVASHILPDGEGNIEPEAPQLDLFTDYEAVAKEKEAEQKERDKEKLLQHAILDIKKRFGKNAVLKGMNLLEGATAKERNEQIGGHKK